jgi:hypothetical protein
MLIRRICEQCTKRKIRESYWLCFENETSQVSKSLWLELRDKPPKWCRYTLEHLMILQQENK